MSEQIKLLPCPFCGGDLPMASLHTDFHKRTSWRVNCFHCGALGSGASTKSRADAIERWNTRAIRPTPSVNQELVEALEYGLKYAKLGFPTLMVSPPIFTKNVFIEKANQAISKANAQAQQDLTNNKKD